MRKYWQVIVVEHPKHGTSYTYGELVAERRPRDHIRVLPTHTIYTTSHSTPADANARICSLRR